MKRPITAGRPLGDFGSRDNNKPLSFHRAERPNQYWNIRMKKDSIMACQSQEKQSFEPDLAMAVKFLHQLDPDGKFTFQTFPDGKNADGDKRRALTRVFNGTFAQYAINLVELNVQGAGVFVTINATDGKGRREENINRVRALFIDLDGAPLSPVLAATIPPHIVVNTSGDRYHAYWLVEGVNLEEFTSLQKALAAKFGGDKKVCDLPRVMRLPGFLHLKNADSPFQTVVIGNRCDSFLTKELLFQGLDIELHTKPVTSSNSVLCALKLHGIPHVEDSEGRWKITCPWVKEHTGAESGGTFYFEPHTNGYASHGFKCFHSHCKNRDWLGHFGISGHRQPTPPTEWSTPLLIRKPQRQVAKMTPDMLPQSLRSWLTDVSERLQVPLEFCAIPAMVAIGSLIGRQLGIKPKQYDSWIVVPNLWGAIIGRPSLLKSPAVAETMRFLAELEDQASQRYELDRLDFEFEEKLTTARQQEIQKNLGKVKQEALNSLKEQWRGMQSPTKPRHHRYKVSDPTVAKLGELLRDNPNGLLLYRDELSGFLKNLEKPGHESDRAFYIEGWDGTTSNYLIDRIGRGTLNIPSLCISVMGTIQPGPLSSYVRQALSGGSGDDGLLQRFQLLVFPDTPDWSHVDRAPNLEAVEEVRRIIQSVAKLALHSADTDMSNIPTVNFTPEAQQEFDRWYCANQVRAREADSPALEAHLAKYPKLMPGLALIFQVVLTLEGTLNVGIEAARLAILWCDLLETHAKRIYGMLGDQGLTGAEVILKKVRAGDLKSPVTIRELGRKNWGGLDDVEAAVDILEEHGWIKVTEKPYTGGRRTELIWLHPDLIPSKVEKADVE